VVVATSISEENGMKELVFWSNLRIDSPIDFADVNGDGHGVGMF
jgi:hypothetical protein